ncbi:hypothetical protein DPX16_17309 [Anabarilius grahami]|uniref:Uncharacterized protein n=1 Tax=Anabarilius grahami TaxID=495550 RepID=A0A3N0YCJ2_ANAGA|nr:hypothetical protein DPX16_17309 [Anabarilius grahami]
MRNILGAHNLSSLLNCPEPCEYVYLSYRNSGNTVLLSRLLIYMSIHDLSYGGPCYEDTFRPQPKRLRTRTVSFKLTHNTSIYTQKHLDHDCDVSEVMPFIMMSPEQNFSELEKAAAIISPELPQLKKLPSSVPSRTNDLVLLDLDSAHSSCQLLLLDFDGGDRDG